jgi:hypothetical protein
MSLLSDEYQTPKKYVRMAKYVMGSIDYDLASSAINHERLKHHINNYFSIEDNSLFQDWTGNCWLNPPYSKPNLTMFTNKLIAQHDRGNFNQLIYLIPSYTAEKWYQKCLKNCSALCFPNHRICHLLEGRVQVAPRFSSTFLYFGPNYESFAHVYSQFGKTFLN